jgi:hypothetical protein
MRSEDGSGRRKGEGEDKAAVSCPAATHVKLLQKLSLYLPLISSFLALTRVHLSTQGVDLREGKALDV